MGLSITDLDYLPMGLVYDMMIESSNDSFEYPYKATKEDIARL